MLKVLGLLRPDYPNTDGGNISPSNQLKWYLLLIIYGMVLIIDGYQVASFRCALSELFALNVVLKKWWNNLVADGSKFEGS